jgi:hypothetical protein
LTVARPLSFFTEESPAHGEGGVLAPCRVARGPAKRRH